MARQRWFRSLRTSAAKTVALLLLLTGFAAEVSASSTSEARRIRIGIVHGVEEVSLEPNAPFFLVEPGGLRRGVGAKRSLTLRPLNAKEVKLGRWVVPSGSRLEAADGQTPSTVRIGDGRYTGPLILRADPDGTVSVVEELDMEEYLLGVLPREMEPDWPVEALKAQAVVARTFAYYNLGKFRSHGYDLSPDTRSQVYKGVGLRSQAVREAVSSTRDEVLGYDGKLLSVYYHSCCGGHTTSPKEVWGKWMRVPRPLKGVKDRYCGKCPHAKWEAYFPNEAVMAALSSDEVLTAGTLDSIVVGRRDPAGFVKDLRFYIPKKTTVDAAAFRRRIGPGELKSLKIRRVVRRSKGVEFVGSGLGHGVGLCQWGARYQAERGRAYEDILAYYFPGSTLSVVDED